LEQLPDENFKQILGGTLEHYVILVLVVFLFAGSKLQSKLPTVAHQ
jgi:hypothetical protein